MTRLSNTHLALRHAWHPVCPALPIGAEPRRVVLLGQSWVVWKGEQGVHAAIDRCAHRRAPLSMGSVDGDGCLQCPYHGWTFGPTGRVASVPALGRSAHLPRASLRMAAGATEFAGLVWVAPSEPIAPLPAVPGIDSLDHVPIPEVVARVGAGYLTDNLLDVAHFPFLHLGTFGLAGLVEVPAYDVARNGWSSIAVFEQRFPNHEDPGVQAGARPLMQTRRLTYTFHAPFSVIIDIEYLETGVVNVIGNFVQPESDERCRLHWAMWRNDLDSSPTRAADAVAFQQSVIAEDIPIQEGYDDLALPLALTDEAHTRADRITIEMRRILADLVAGASLMDSPHPSDSPPAHVLATG
jgi:phenylpropionate dioxygenase-like ring-hydroxylating dioxygenase large terminal subunit